MDKQNYVLCRKFNLTLISAENLPNVRKFFKSQVYARVSFGGDKKTEQRTRTDRHGELNPVWNYTMKYTIGESGVVHHGLQLVIKLYCKSKLGDQYIGEIHASVKELFDYAYICGGSASLSLPITKGRAGIGGILRFSYRFGEKILKKKPGICKRLLLPGICILLRVVGFAALGVVIPVHFDAQPNIIDEDILNAK